MNDLLNKLKTFWTKTSPYRIPFMVIITIIVIAILYFSARNAKNKALELQLKYDVATAQMKTFKDKDSTQTAQILVFEASSKRDFLKIKSSDSTIIFLQSEVKKYKNQIKEPGSSVTTATSTTNNSGTLPTHVTNPVPTNTVSPIYSANKTNAWIDLAISATKDSISYKLAVRNKYSVIIGYEKGLPTAIIKNYNPYTETTDMKSYQVTMPKTKRLGIGLQGGYGFGSGGLTPYVGIGVSYNIFFLKL